MPSAARSIFPSVGAANLVPIDERRARYPGLVTTELLINALVRQTTVLIAQLATSGGARTPLAAVAEQVFLDLVQELARQGVSRKVSADMFGMALRTFRRRIQRQSESRTVANRSLWEAVHSFIGEQAVVSQFEVLRRFHRDDEELVRAVLQDLAEGALVFRSGKGASAKYHLARGSDFDDGDDAARQEAIDMLVAAVLYRMGPADRSAIQRAAGFPEAVLAASLDRLVAADRAVTAGIGATAVFRVPSLVVPIGTSAGWEAAVFDHYQALVATICAKLRVDPTGARKDDTIGGSTYTLEVCAGHPLEAEATGELSLIRARLSDLRARIADHNLAHPLPVRRKRVVLYAGQNVTEEEEDGDEHDDTVE